MTPHQFVIALANHGHFLSAKKLSEEILLFDEPDRWQIVHRLRDSSLAFVIPDQRFWRVLGNVLVHTHEQFPFREQIRDIVHQGRGLETRPLMMQRRERHHLRGLGVVPLQIYRGCGKDRVMGWNWTTNAATAPHFAKYSPAGGSFVAEGKVDPTKIISSFLRRGEAEVFVDPREVQSVQVYDRRDFERRVLGWS